MRVAIAFSAQRQTPDTDLREVVAALSDALQELGHIPIPVPLAYDVAAFWHALAGSRADVVWNLCEEASGRAGRELHAAALVELLDRPVTGTSAATLALCLDKSVCRQVLAGSGVPVPDAVRVAVAGQVPRDVPLPAIVKPACQDGSVGIDRDSVCADRAAVESAVARLGDQGLLPALVQGYVDGRELNVLLLGPAAGPLAHVAIGEIDLSAVPAGAPRVLTYAGKWHPDSDEFLRTPSHYPADITPQLADRVREIGEHAFAALHLSGYARLDLRVDAEGRCFVIDVNGNPDISPGAGLQRALPTLGLSFADFVALQLQWAWVR